MSCSVVDLQCLGRHRYNKSMTRYTCLWVESILQSPSRQTHWSRWLHDLHTSSLAEPADRLHSRSQCTSQNDPLPADISSVLITGSITAPLTDVHIRCNISFNILIHGCYPGLAIWKWEAFEKSTAPHRLGNWLWWKHIVSLYVGQALRSGAFLLFNSRNNHPPLPFLSSLFLSSSFLRFLPTSFLFQNLARRYSVWGGDLGRKCIFTNFGPWKLI